MLLKLLVGLLLMTSSSVVLCDDAHVNGTWSPVIDWPLSPIHMVLLKTGKVLTYGNQNNGKLQGPFYYDVFDPTSLTHETFTTDHHGGSNTDGTNIFCSGQVTVPSTGEVLITGGSRTIDEVKNYGSQHVQFFNSDTKKIYLADENMHFTRWYPSVTVLGNQHIVVQGGRSDNIVGARTYGTTPEVYNPKTGKWRMLLGANNTLYAEKSAWWYPKSYSAKGNTVIVFPNHRNELWKLDPSGDGSLELVATIPGEDFNYRLPSAMFDRNKILAIQGIQDAVVLDITNPDQPTFEATESLREPRYWANMVNLPNGEVLVVGGASVKQIEENAVKYAEIWNPQTGKWRTGATAIKSRLYHSTALLLPDATVLVGGGGPPGPVVNRDAEIYEPPYLFKADGTYATRPSIVSLSSEPQYGDTIQVDFQYATKISRVSLIRYGSVTHSFNMDERMLRLSFEQHANALSLDVKFIFSKSVAPPGYYLLFIVDNKGVPSVARTIHLI